MNSNSIDFRDELDQKAHQIEKRVKKNIKRAKKRANKTMASGVTKVVTEVSKLDVLCKTIIRYKYVPLILPSILYICSPIDFIPEMFLSTIGYVDDALLFIGCIFFIIYTKKKGVSTDGYKSSNAADKSDQELYSYLVRNSSKSDSNTTVSEQDTPNINNPAGVADMLSDIFVDAMPSTSSSTESNAEPTSTTITSRSSTNDGETKPENKDEFRSIFSTGVNRNIASEHSAKEKFSTACRPQTQYIQEDECIW